ncbi:MARVEL domain-containing protein 1 [Hyla sarda]|uniref:MARVEL domain-containing protein 1 n=1 Tax=Hyla sarda TaxID=327740 RepID=UPI0024C2FB52|nr:MARVEL domain-containing protein 1 [Hyla sarda]
MSTTQATRSSLSANKTFLRSFPGVLRLLQLAMGAALWITIASNNYSGAVHFVLFVAVFFWLLTLILYFLTLLDKQELVPLLGGQHWLLTNLIYDALATVLHIAATIVMATYTDQNSFCTLEGYQFSCPYNTYLAASIFASLCSFLYLLTTVCFIWKKCQGGQSII